ncbi:MAG: hypothetical protein PHE89_07500 [Alphaproteobacteria bacterium]|nr:hypothetical protein [Alphaproteobacteria bacterium]
MKILNRFQKIAIKILLIGIFSATYGHKLHAETQAFDNWVVSNDEFEYKSLRRYLKYPVRDVTAPEYRKVFDEYIIDLEHLQKYDELPDNPKKTEDLSKMNYNGPIKLK